MLFDNQKKYIFGEDIILQRCRSYNIPIPNLIVEYDKNSLQCEWDFQEPLYIFKAEIIDYWKLVQYSLSNLFCDIGGDVSIATDTTFYLFNKSKPSKNIKVIYENTNTKDRISLSKIYYALKNAGVIKQIGGKYA